MAVTVGGTSITFNDATVQTTAFTTATVLTAVAGGSAGAVGTYMWGRSTTAANVAFGSTVAGSTLLPCGAAYSVGVTAGCGGSGSIYFPPSGPTAQSGTWRNMGYFQYAQTCASPPVNGSGSSLWLRIS